MDSVKIQRINELAKKSKTTGLTPEEALEQQTLRKEYIAAFRNDLKSTLDSVLVVDKSGNKSPLKKERRIELPSILLLDEETKEAWQKHI